MTFYELSKVERIKLVRQIHQHICGDIAKKNIVYIYKYFSDEDTYIRKSAYIEIGKIYNQDTSQLTAIIKLLNRLATDTDFKVRQTVINAAGEIGKRDFEAVKHFFDHGLFDAHHSPRNAVIGSIKKMGEVNPKPILSWAKNYIHHTDKEIRREICHGIELRGRKYPEDILPLLKELEHDPTSRVYKTLVHVIGQIAYKKGCLEKVIAHLKTWKNSALVAEAIYEIIDVHHRYRNFSYLTQEQAKKYIQEHY